MVAEQFDSAEQQHEAALLGIWTFLATEILFFGGLFLGYIVYRHTYHESWVVASQQTNLLYGTINTAILLTSSFTMALGVRAAQQGRNQILFRYLLVTIFFAIAFMGVKAAEYTEDIREHLVPGPSFSLKGAAQGELFFVFYWAMTGLHAIHVLVGIGVLSVMAFLAFQRRFDKDYYTPVELSGLYWHFVDIVWIFLYPLIYLINRH
ncbi:cytochrome c oxidase subunit III [Pedosphaera parvula Ellin514]|uniref:Cytochrome c oxidase subunit III n=2 Tax=Pedosphaera TaxID=1032526 RepID=B9XE49_PEDPL|nr:cytochrome c oxidase subunit III [Pedosphaera parvula Ellin514]